jgi:class 3 adenylate cyclase
LLAQVNETEILAPQIRFQRNMMILACTLALLTTLAAMLLANRFLRPVNQLIDGIARMRSGATDVQLRERSDDEFGRLTQNFNAMSAAIRDRDQIIVDKSVAHDAFLRRMFPNNVVDRLRKGDTQIVDTVSNVTVIYASVIGFVKATEGMDAIQSMTLLSELFDIMDALAAEHGVDRVKTFAEHYVAVAGLSVPRLDHAQRALAFCDALSREIERVSGERSLKFQLRASLASGDITAGLVGNQRFVFDIWGKPLNLVRRLVHEASANEVRASEETHALLGPEQGFQERPTVAGMTLGAIRSYGRPLGNTSVPAQTKLIPRAAE